MSEKDTLRLFTAITRTARENSRIIFRNLMVPRDVPDSLKQQIIKNEELSRFIYNNDRSFVYGKVVAYEFSKSK